ADASGGEEAERELAEILKGNTGKVKIGNVTGAAVEHGLPANQEARVHLPKGTGDVGGSTDDVPAPGLLEGNLDFILGRLSREHDPRLFEAHFGGPEPISLIVRRGHPLLRRPEVAMERLMEFDWVLPLEGALLRTTLESTLLTRG